MNCAEMQTLLADYLGGELDSATRGAAREHLDQCGGCRTAATRLQSAAATFEAGLVSPALAAGATSGLSLHGERVRADEQRASRRISSAIGVLRYAAVFLVAFGGGFWAANMRTAVPAAPATNPPVSPAVAPPIHPSSWSPDSPVAEQYVAAARAYPKSTSLTWSLLSIAKR